MSKITLNNVTNIDAISVINDNFNKIALALQNQVLYRNNPVGEINTLQNSIDFNGYDIINIGDVTTTNGQWATTGQLDIAVAAVEADRAEVENNKNTVAADKALVLGYKNSAETAATNAALSYDNFDDRYLGAKSVEPTLDNDGNALLVGALYFRTSGSPLMRVYNGTAWQDAAATTTNIVNTVDPLLMASNLEATTGVSTTKVMNPANTKAAIDARNIMPTTGGTFSGNVFGTKADLGAGVSINVASASVFTKTVSAPTTFVLTGVPAAPTFASFILELTNPGTNVTFWSGVKWSNGLAPILTVTGKDLLAFYTVDGGTTWNGIVLGKDVR
jgi:hypothetical protein